MAAQKDEPHIKTAGAVGGVAGGIAGAAVQKVMLGAVSPPMAVLSLVVGAAGAIAAEVHKPSTSMNEAVCKSAVVGGIAGGVTSYACIQGKCLLRNEQKDALVEALKQTGKYPEKSGKFLLKKAMVPAGKTKMVLIVGSGALNTYMGKNAVENCFEGPEDPPIRPNEQIIALDDESEDGEEYATVVTKLDDEGAEGELVTFIWKHCDNAMAKLNVLSNRKDLMVKARNKYRQCVLRGDPEEQIKTEISQLIDSEMNKKNQL